MNITLTKEERADFIRTARQEFVAEIMEAAREDIDLISRAQAAGLLDVTPNTLVKIPGLERVELIPNNVIKYRRSQILEVIKKQTIKQ